nr:hypothetical protein CFP56_17978 [Quercus suber]
MISTDDKEEEPPSKPSKKLSVFYRIGQPIPYILVFDRLGTQEDDNFVTCTRSSVLARLSHSASPQNGTRSFALTRLSYATSSQLSKDEKLRRQQNKTSNFFHRDVDDTLLMDQDSNEVRSSIPSQMKRRSIWEVNTREALTAKKCTMVSPKLKVDDEVVALVNHITITEVIKEESPFEENVEDAPPIFEKGIQATVDELKEINTNTTEDVLRISLINGKFLKCYYA